MVRNLNALNLMTTKKKHYDNHVIYYYEIRKVYNICGKVDFDIFQSKAFSPMFFLSRHIYKEKVLPRKYNCSLFDRF